MLFEFNTMPKSCFLYTFLVCVLWFTVYEVESGKNDLEYWKPTRDRTTTVQTEDSYPDDSDDDDNIEDDSTEDSDDSTDTGVDSSDYETKSGTDKENEGRRNGKGERYHTQGRKNKSKHHNSKVHTKQIIVQKHNLRTYSPTKRSTQTKSRITHRDRTNSVLNTISSVRYRARGHTKLTLWSDEEYPSRRPKVRFQKKRRPILRFLKAPSTPLWGQFCESHEYSPIVLNSTIATPGAVANEHKWLKWLNKSTRMAPNHEMQQFVDEDDTTKQRTTTKKIFDGISIDELSPFSIARQLPEFDCKFPDANITHEIIGRTAEFNDIVLLRVTESKTFRAFRADNNDDVNKFVDEAPSKKIVFIVHGLSVMGFNSIPCFKKETDFTTLLSYYFNHLDKFDIFLIPMANPDGVALNRPFWNKNNSPQIDCPGVSLDRNFEVAWNATRGMSSCSQRYPGAAPFSERETVAVREVFHRYSNRIIAYLHVHAGSYSHDIYKGDAVLYPKGYTEVQSDHDKYIDLKGDIDEAMRNASFRFLSVAVESLNRWYGPISGSSVDYASTVYGIPFALEVVFQIYEGIKNPMAEGEIASSNMPLVEIWRRMLDVIFNNIWKNSHLNDLRL